MTTMLRPSAVAIALAVTLVVFFRSLRNRRGHRAGGPRFRTHGLACLRLHQSDRGVRGSRAL